MGSEHRKVVDDQMDTTLEERGLALQMETTVPRPFGLHSGWSTSFRFFLDVSHMSIEGGMTGLHAVVVILLDFILLLACVEVPLPLALLV